LFALILLFSRGAPHIGRKSIFFLYIVVQYLNKCMRGVHVLIQRGRDEQIVEWKTFPIMVYFEYKGGRSPKRVPAGRL
jgi:hypothetical protein